MPVFVVAMLCLEEVERQSRRSMISDWEKWSICSPSLFLLYCLFRVLDVTIRNQNNVVVLNYLSNERRVNLSTVIKRRIYTGWIETNRSYFHSNFIIRISFAGKTMCCRINNINFKEIIRWLITILWWKLKEMRSLFQYFSFFLTYGLSW